MDDSLILYIKDYLEDALRNNKYTYYISRKKMKGYKIIDRPSIEFNDCDITKYLKFSEKFNKLVLEFNDKLKVSFPKEYSTLFNKNIKTVNILDYKLHILEKMKYFFMYSPSGSYDSYFNSIELLKNVKDEKELKKIIFHELLHLSSSTDLVFSGFSQEILTKKGPVQIGDGLNEGYTEHLNRTYFSDCVNNYSYHDQVQFAALIEEIVGKDFMLDCYFNKGLAPLLKRLGEKISDNGKAIDVILDLDGLLGKNNVLLNKNKYSSVRSDLVSYYNIELNNKLEKGLISEKEHNKRKFLNVDRFMMGDDFYSNKAIIFIEDEYICIKDYNEVKKIKDNKINIKSILDSDIIESSIKK